ncbi:MAG: hypothetical protein IKL58_00295 [Phascolarctobacterium sp.]|nr:hypothetical protein [Phascolarctobacterium sp.]
MPRFNVEVNGEWACYSSISESFLTEFMPLQEYEEWRDKEYGKNKTPLEHANRVPLKEVLRDMSICNSDDYILRELRNAGLLPCDEC